MLGLLQSMVTAVSAIYVLQAQSCFGDNLSKMTFALIDIRVCADFPAAVTARRATSSASEAKAAFGGGDCQAQAGTSSEQQEPRAVQTWR